QGPFRVVRQLTPSARRSTLKSEHVFVRTRDPTPRLSGGSMLTARQQEIWQFLVDYTDGHGYPPTVREIGEAVGLASPSTVHAHLANLERAGLLRRDPTKPRALELIGHRTVTASAPVATASRADDVARLPLVGQIAAGAPLLAEENIEEHIAVPEPLGRSADFLLTVRGDSMIEAGILARGPPPGLHHDHHADG